MKDAKIGIAGRTSKSILFVCSANSIRSPMAQGLWALHAPDWKVESAGSEGCGEINSLSLSVLEELGISTSQLYSKSIHQVHIEEFDVKVVLSREALVWAKETIPNQFLHWDTPDPLTLSINRIDAFRQVRDRIQQNIILLLSSYNF